ncbi:MAG: AMP-binding protein [Gemmatimonadetes bacterium]|nr:AMP-binding protein [Gemmatimonadota bacterium]
MRDQAWAALRDRVLAVFRQPLDTPLPDPVFDELARAVFAWQCRYNEPFAAFCRNRGRTPATVAHWTDIPAVPTEAFKHVDLVVGRPADAAAVFRTSGTTLGGERRGTHYVLDLSLYEGALLPVFAGYVLPDGARPLLLSLMPRPAELPDSSLAHMISTVIDRLGAPGSGWHATVAGGIDHHSLAAALRAATERGQPVCLLGTSLAFVHWLDGLEARGEKFALPSGSRLMDTGGYKGRNRTIESTEMLARYRALLGIGPEWCVNEYGMTELCSQLYDAQLRDTVLGRASAGRRKLPAPWLRTRVVDPETLAPLPPGREGLLQHFDLANLGSVVAVQTEDVGVQIGGGFRLLGRVLGAAPRGCSIAVDDLLRAAGRTPGGHA